MDAFEIDISRFCRLKERRDGELLVKDLPRLAAESVDGFGSLRWELQGGSGNLGHPQLELAVAGTVKLVCQRCLQSFDFPIDSTATLVVAESDAAANELGDLFESEDVEVIVGSSGFNVLQLIEDDALLAIPFSPRHDVCPENAVLPAGGAIEKESPFAVLKKLKQ